MQTRFSKVCALLALLASSSAIAQYIPPQQGGQGSAAQGAQPGAPGAAQGGGPRAFTYPPLQPSTYPPGGAAAGGAMPGALPPPINLPGMALDSVAPMTAEQVREMMTEFMKRSGAARENFTERNQAKPVTSVQTLDLSPGAVPPVVRVAVGQGSVLSFADAAGRPWEIVDNINFHGGAFDVKLIAPHLYTVSLKQPAAANITIVLKDLPRPIVVTAVPAQAEVDYLVEFTVPRFVDGKPPAAALVTASSAASPSFNAPELLNYLYRMPPSGAVALKVVGADGVMAWQNSPTTMVVRTDSMPILPAWIRRHVATDGVGAYELPLSPVLSVARGGQVLRASVSGFVVSAATATKSAVAAGK